MSSQNFFYDVGCRIASESFVDFRIKTETIAFCCVKIAAQINKMTNGGPIYS